MSDLELTYEKLEEFKTPAYFYSENIIGRQYQSLKQALPSDFGLFFSLKSNSNMDVVNCLRGLGAWADVASYNELKVALACGYTGEQVEFTGPGKSMEALKLAVQNNLASIVVESLQELECIEYICKTLQMHANVSIRVNPKRYFSHNGKAIVSSGTQFGIDEEDVPAFLDHLTKMERLNFVGVHVFTQSQYLDAQPLVQNLNVALDIAKFVATLFGKPLKIVNLGGGFGIPYYKDDRPLNLNLVQQRLKNMMIEARKIPELSQSIFCVESGRFLTGPAGLYVAKVLYTKTSRKKNYAILSGGFSHNMAACGFGQFLRRNYLISTVQKIETTKTEVVNIVGPSCYSLDVLGVDAELPRLEPGDYVIVHNSGSYGPQFSPSRFLLLENAEEYFLKRI